MELYLKLFQIFASTSILHWVFRTFCGTAVNLTVTMLFDNHLLLLTWPFWCCTLKSWQKSIFIYSPHISSIAHHRYTQLSCSAWNIFFCPKKVFQKWHRSTFIPDTQLYFYFLSHFFSLFVFHNLIISFPSSFYFPFVLLRFIFHFLYETFLTLLSNICLRRKTAPSSNVFLGSDKHDFLRLELVICSNGLIYSLL